MKHPKRPIDAVSKAVYIAKLATGEITEPNPDEGKNPAAVALGRLGGLKGGKARAESLSVFAVCTFFAAPVFGVLSDRYGRKSILLISLLV